MSDINSEPEGFQPGILTIDGMTLTCHDVAEFASGRYQIQLSQEALGAVERGWRLTNEAASKQLVYGRSTGVGGNKSEVVEVDAASGHGARLLRSHAVGVGELMSDEHTRAMMVIRCNQLAVGRAGTHPRVLQGLVGALNGGCLPNVHRIGAIGTGDLTALAELGLTLAGVRPWRVNPVPAIPVDDGDALAFMSSSAATLAEAALATVDLRRLLHASHVVAALSFAAMGGCAEAYAAAVHTTRSHSGQVQCAHHMAELLGIGEQPTPGRAIQDPYGLRAFPQVQGVVLDAAQQLDDVLAIEINAGAENPMVSPADGKIYHHGHFHGAYVAVGLDHLRNAVSHVAHLSTARLSQLMKPTQTDLPAFLASGAPGSSGVMILEYVAHDALAELRHAAMPVTTGAAVISLGMEDHASFSTQAARQAVRAAAQYRIVLACELVAAVRALSMRPASLNGLPLQPTFERLAAGLDASLEDRELTEDITRAAIMLDDLDDPGQAA